MEGGKDDIPINSLVSRVCVAGGGEVSSQFCGSGRLEQGEFVEPTVFENLISN